MWKTVIMAGLAFLMAFSKVEAHQLGSVVEKYEGSRNPCTVGHEPNGSLSYGLYQFNGKMMELFVKETAGLKLPSHLTGAELYGWYRVKCAENPAGYAKAQRAFAQKYWFKPVRKYADQLGIPHGVAINEALFSLAIQHGGYRKILKMAGEYTSRHDWLANLYVKRMGYVMGLPLPDRVKASLWERYKSEFRDVINLREVPASAYY